jgi:lipid-binding SYLF domain-containing protein
MSNRKSMAFFGFLIILCLTTVPAVAEEAPATPETVVEKARIAFGHVAIDPDMSGFQNLLKKAKALLIMPEQFKAGFLLGGSGGTGVLLAREGETDLWSHPAFYSMGAGSIGLQIGFQVAELSLLIMTQKGLNALLNTKVQLGGDVSVALGPIGAGAHAATTDVIAFSRTKGFYGGLSIEGAVIVPRKKLNNLYYGQATTPLDILIRRSANNSDALPLVTAVSEAAKSNP